MGQTYNQVNNSDNSYKMNQLKLSEFAKRYNKQGKTESNSYLIIKL